MKTKNCSASLRKKLPLVLALLLSLAPLLVLSQQPMYAIVEYMKTKPGKEWNYIELERNFWKPVHVERIRQGEIVGWMLYRIRYTAGNDPYNYATVTLFNQTENLEQPGTIDPLTVHPDKDVENWLTETDESRELVIRNLLIQQNFIVPNGEGGDPKFLEVDYMKVKQGNDLPYRDLENKIWKPVHQQLIQSGTRTGWSVWARLYPSGYGMDYQYMTINELANFSQIALPDYEKAIKSAHPHRKVDDIRHKTNQLRTLVKSELWELLDAAY
ncbi:hypothetical protein [Mangrovibacterium marinum]|uniref:hypothetical protein n=1 Tax=Mangrovibacterium marinum TaxID=1639118 RepID=UPI002A1890DF|nr:hypothetical protein [Mangrovibacterium marinum]